MAGTYSDVQKVLLLRETNKEVVQTSLCNLILQSSPSGMCLTEVRQSQGALTLSPASKSIIAGGFGIPAFGAWWQIKKAAG